MTANTGMRCVYRPVASCFVGMTMYISESKNCQCDVPMRPSITFLGSGSSTGCPRPLCSMVFSNKATESLSLLNLRMKMEKYCSTSKVAAVGYPKMNKNYRNNPSLLISFLPSDSSDPVNVIIDVGKTFRETALCWLPDLGVTSLDAIILTHEHMDAAAGLDDVRGFQQCRFSPKNQRLESLPIPLFLSDHCYTKLRDQFPWLLPEPTDECSPTAVKRHVASFQVSRFQPF